MRVWTISAFALSCLLGASTFLARKHGAVLDKQLVEARRIERSLRTERTALVASLGRITPSEPYLVGRDVVGDTMLRVIRPKDGVYYLIATTCAACSRNLPFLDSLSQGSGVGGVFVLALQRDKATVKDYAQRHRIGVPVVTELEGFLPAAVPKYVTPLTTIVWDGRITSFIAGDIQPRDKMEILASFEARRIKGR